MVFQATMGWDELARAILQDILTKQGGVCAALPFLSFFIVLFTVAVCWKIVSKEEKEMDRMADRNKELEEKILKRRQSSKSKGNRK